MIEAWPTNLHVCDNNLAGGNAWMVEAEVEIPVSILRKLVA